MTLEQLKSVENFSIENEHVKITWPGRTNLIRLNLDMMVRLSYGSADVYPEDIFKNEHDPSDKNSKPMKGTQLNKKAMITYFDIRNKKNAKDFEQKLRKKASNAKARHVRYDLDRLAWTIEVDHF